MVTLRFEIPAGGTVKLHLANTDWSIFNDSTATLRKLDSEGDLENYQPVHSYSSIDGTFYDNRKPVLLYNPSGAGVNISVMIEEPSGGLDMAKVGP